MYDIYFICSKISLSVTAEAKFVVSDSGDILSPKYDPEIIAPAVISAGTAKTLPIAKRAIPIVAIVLQELPIDNETIAVIIQVAIKK